MTQLVESVTGMGDAARILIRQSFLAMYLYNETDGNAIQPCPVIGMVGVIDNVETAVGNGFIAAGNHILVIGQGNDTIDGWLGASIYQQHFGDNIIYAPPPIDLAAERRHGSFVRQQILAGKINAAHDISDGGLRLRSLKWP